MTTIDPTPTSLPAALAEPMAPVRRGWIALIFAANLGVWMAFFTPIQVLLPQQVERIAPLDKEAMLAVVTGIGALAAVLANPLAGALSDRTCLRIGGRDFGHGTSGRRAARCSARSPWCCWPGRTPSPG